MAKKNHLPGVIPPGNRSGGPLNRPDSDDDAPQTLQEGEPFNDQDPKRRLGDHTGAGEHAIQQPRDFNDG